MNNTTFISGFEKSIPLLSDMHTHSENSHDSFCPLSDMCDKQIAAGVSVFAVTDHYDGCCLAKRDVLAEVENSIRDIDRHIPEYSNRIEILRGVEIGEGTWNAETEKKVRSLADYDVILGSMHAVRFDTTDNAYSAIDFSGWSRSSILKYIDKYFDELTEMAEKLDFDILTHIDCPLRYINGKYNLGIDVFIYEQKIKRILDIIIERKIALEVNTSAMFAKYPLNMPDTRIISLYRDMGGIMLTVGSDAHTAENAARGISEARKFLSGAGFPGTFIFRQRKPIFVPFE